MGTTTPFDLNPWPVFGFFDDARPALNRALQKGSAILVTIIDLHGGGPRPVGTQMVFGEGEASGFLSGGCIEADVALHAAACLTDGEPRRLVYGTGSPWPDIRLMCGARLEVLVERILPDDAAAAALRAYAKTRQSAVWLTDGTHRACTLPEHAQPWAGAFERRFDPAPRLIIFGGDPTALAIASLGVSCGHETWLVRPNGPSDAPPIPGLHYSRAAPGQALADIGLDAWTAVAVCHHDMDLDEAALVPVLESDAPYVGLLGARARLPDRLARLKKAGLTERKLARLRAPIGLDLGGKAPFEIAVAVLGEITAVRNLDLTSPVPGLAAGLFD
ncbi:XdhC family protein [Caulobacter segnis]|uniref:XdhC family protein n=1 Tax=Caulobacter segnis TaxID=88688 RepID=UPI00240EBF0B|nr:XdhC family protein [Caulobacter segnis]MDG2521603.1 XdhC family protein [Caulobacter segnis]